jgi:hypothetical protein
MLSLRNKPKIFATSYHENLIHVPHSVVGELNDAALLLQHQTEKNSSIMGS